MGLGLKYLRNLRYLCKPIKLKKKLLKTSTSNEDINKILSYTVQGVGTWLDPRSFLKVLTETQLFSNCGS